VEANRKASSNLAQVLDEEHASAQAERETLMSHIRGLLEDSNQRQNNRLKGKFDILRTDISASGDSLEHATAQHDRHIDEWIFKEEQFAKDITASKDEIKTRMQNDWEVRMTNIAVWTVTNINRPLTSATPRFSGQPSPCIKRLFVSWMLK
jgi:kinesin family protein 11